MRKISKNCSKKSPWLTPPVKKLLRFKKESFARLKAHDTTVNKAAYKLATKNAKRGVRMAKRSAELKLAENCAGNTKKFFSYYKFKTKSTSVGPLEVDGKLLVDDLDITNALSKQFSSVFTRETVFNPLNLDPSLAGDSLDVLELTEDIVRDCLKEIKVNKAAGPDEIYGRFLNECAVE